MQNFVRVKARFGVWYNPELKMRWSNWHFISLHRQLLIFGKQDEQFWKLVKSFGISWFPLNQSFGTKYVWISYQKVTFNLKLPDFMQFELLRIAVYQLVAKHLYRVKNNLTSFITVPRTDLHTLSFTLSTSKYFMNTYFVPLDTQSLCCHIA